MTTLSFTAKTVSFVPSTTPADVSEESDVAALMQQTVAAYGRLDVLHNNAAALGPDVFPYDTTVVTMEVDVWDRTMAVNLRGVMLGCKHAIPLMRDGDGGSIVSTSSLSSLVGEDTHLAYACSKAAIGALTRHVANMHGAAMHFASEQVVLRRRNLLIRGPAFRAVGHLFDRRFGFRQIGAGTAYRRGGCG